VVRKNMQKRDYVIFSLFILLILSIIIIPKGKALTYTYTYHEALTNRGFETGTEANWTDVANDWDITTIQHHGNGTYSAHCSNTGNIYQTLVVTNFSSGVPVTQIANISFWFRVESSSANIQCYIYYSDISFTIQNFPSGAYVWTFCNITMNTLETAKNVTRLYFLTGINTNHWLDDASLIYRKTIITETPDYSGFVTKVIWGLISIVMLILTPIISDKMFKGDILKKIFIWIMLWLLFGFMFYSWIYIW
jgi:hypothetical protein